MVGSTKTRQAVIRPETAREAATRIDSPTGLLWKERLRLDYRDLQKHFQKVLADNNAIREQLREVQNDNATLRKELVNSEKQHTGKISSLQSAFKKEKEARMAGEKRLQTTAELILSRVDGLEVEIRRARSIANRTQADMDDQSCKLSELESRVELSGLVVAKGKQKEGFDKNSRIAHSKFIDEQEEASAVTSNSLVRRSGKGRLGKSNLNTQVSNREEALPNSTTFVEERALRTSIVNSKLPRQGEQTSAPVIAGKKSRKRPFEESNVTRPDQNKRFIPQPEGLVTRHSPSKKKQWIKRSISGWYD